MPRPLNNLEIKGYFSPFKSIQPNYRFFVSVFDKNILNSLPLIKHWHVLSVTLPNYDWKKDLINYGPVPKSFPYLEYDGLELPIVFEEDDLGTIADFIHSLQKRVVNPDGTYNAPNNVKISRIMVTVEDYAGIISQIYTFYDCYLLQAGNVEYAYNGNESVKYNCTFNADYYSIQLPKRGVINSLKASASKLLGNII